MEKIKQLTSDNLVDNNIEALKQLFPTAFAEGKVVMEELQALLGDYVEKDKEYYEFNWAGKHLARQEANKVSTGTLRPCKEESKNWDDTQNLYIEGDNLEVLKLMQKTYSNKVKMIYIDPPYNTGKDFVYKDNYKDNLNNYLEISGQLDEDGKKLSSNTEADGRYHSNWLNMMYPRLRLARNLLTDDGVIFISIDDNEQANLKKLCDEVFGEENFVNILSVRRRAKSLNLQFAHNGLNTLNVGFEYVLIYRKSNLLILNPIEKLKKVEVHKGVWNVFWSNADRPTMRYEILGYTPIEGQWRWSKELADEAVLNYKNYLRYFSDKVSIEEYWEKTGKRLRFIRKIEDGIGKNGGIQYWIAPKNSSLRTTNWTDIEVSEIHKEFDLNFSNPKSKILIKELIKLVSFDNINFLILDFFSGSSTTAHAVMALNAEDGGNRKCISVQLPEPTEEKSEAYKAGYTTIAEIGKERIRRAGAKIAEEIDAKIKELEDKIDKLSKELPTDETKAEIAKLKSEVRNLNNQDLGFRVFKLDSSNIKRWDTAPESLEQQLDMFDEAIKSDRTEEDMLYEILLKYGLDLSTAIMEKVVDGCTIYNVGFGSLYVCLSENIQPTVAQAIAEWHKEFEDTNPNVIFSDSGFNGNDAAKTNAVQTLRQMGIENVRSI